MSLATAACVLANPDYDGESDTVGGSGLTGGTIGASGASGATDVSASAGTASASGTSTGSTSSAGTSGTTGESSGPVSAGSDVTSGGTTEGVTDGTTDGTTGTTDGTTGTTGEPLPDVMRLQHYMDGAACDQPLWCYNTQQGIYAGLPGRVYSQECFTGLTPPFRVTRVGYHVGANVGGPAMPSLALRPLYGGKPDLTPLHSTPLVDVSVGYHEVTVDWQVDATSFCVGLAGGTYNTGTALGVAADPGVPPPQGQSFLRIETAVQGCNLPDYVDIKQLNTIPLGAWCIDVDIIPL